MNWQFIRTHFNFTLTSFTSPTAVISPSSPLCSAASKSFTTPSPQQPKFPIQSTINFQNSQLMNIVNLNKWASTPDGLISSWLKWRMLLVLDRIVIEVECSVIRKASEHDACQLSRDWLQVDSEPRTPGSQVCQLLKKITTGRNSTAVTLAMLSTAVVGGGRSRFWRKSIQI